MYALRLTFTGSTRGRSSDLAEDVSGRAALDVFSVFLGRLEVGDRLFALVLGRLVAVLMLVAHRCPPWDRASTIELLDVLRRARDREEGQQQHLEVEPERPVL